VHFVKNFNHPFCHKLTSFTHFFIEIKVTSIFLAKSRVLVEIGITEKGISGFFFGNFNNRMVLVSSRKLLKVFEFLFFLFFIFGERRGFFWGFLLVVIYA